jgi:hypothetical protein
MSHCARLALIWALSFLAGVGVCRTFGANYTWTASSGTWSTAGNWNPSVVPTDLDTAIIANGGTATIASGVTATCSVLNLGAAASGTVQLLPGGYLANGVLFGGEYVGNAGNGIVNQTGGTNSTITTLTLGNLGGSSGTYGLSGNSQLSAGTLVVGNAGSGLFNQSGGTTGVSGAVTLGNGGNGTYNLSGGSLAVAGNFNVGNAGSGTFVQTGGAVSQTGSNNFVAIGVNAGGSGFYNLVSGSLAATYEYLGYAANTSGSVSQSGGSHTVSNELDVGYGSGGTGTYTLSGGSLTVSGNLNVGNSGSGTFTLGGSGLLTANQEHISQNGGAPLRRTVARIR